MNTARRDVELFRGYLSFSHLWSSANTIYYLLFRRVFFFTNKMIVLCYNIDCEPFRMLDAVKLITRHITL